MIKVDVYSMTYDFNTPLDEIECSPYDIVRKHVLDACKEFTKTLAGLPGFVTAHLYTKGISAKRQFGVLDAMKLAAFFKAPYNSTERWIDLFAEQLKLDAAVGSDTMLGLLWDIRPAPNNPRPFYNIPKIEYNHGTYLFYPPYAYTFETGDRIGDWFITDDHGNSVDCLHVCDYWDRVRLGLEENNEDAFYDNE